MDDDLSGEGSDANGGVVPQWAIGGGKTGRFILPKEDFTGPVARNYHLKNTVTQRCLHRKTQYLGIDLGWTEDTRPRFARKAAQWFFRRRGGDAGPVVYDEDIALGNGNKPSFVCHDERTTGSKLGYSGDPVFEWRLLGGAAGTPVQTGDRIALFNAKTRECLIAFDRAGGAIGWPGSLSLWGQVGAGVLMLAVRLVKGVLGLDRGPRYH